MGTGWFVQALLAVVFLGSLRLPCVQRLLERREGEE